MHHISHQVFQDGTPRSVLEECAAAFAEVNCDRQENPFADWNPLHEHRGICSSREEAEKLLDAQGDYNDGYVRFYDYEPTKKGCPKADDLEHRARERADALCAYAVQHSVKRRESKLIGCPECGSKISREAYRCGVRKDVRNLDSRYLTSNHLIERCPICGGVLISKTAKDRIDSGIDAIGKLYKRADQERAAAAKRGKKIIRILAKFECHC